VACGRSGEQKKTTKGGQTKENWLFLGKREGEKERFAEQKKLQKGNLLKTKVGETSWGEKQVKAADCRAGGGGGGGG